MLRALPTLLLTPPGLQPAVGPWNPGYDVEVLRAFGSESLDAVTSHPLGDNWADAFSLFTSDGSVAPWVEDFTTDGIAEGYGTVAPYRAPDIGIFNMAISKPVLAVSDGDVALRVVQGLRQLGPGIRMKPQVLVRPSDDVWSVIDGACPGNASSVFLANGRLYVTWAEGSSVWWERPSRLVRALLPSMKRPPPTT